LNLAGKGDREMTSIETEVVVVGTGPGGATLAKEFACMGREVVMVEKGRQHEFAVGRLASLGSINRIVRPKHGKGLIFRGVSVGGSSMVFNGNAYDPPAFLKSELAIDLSLETAEARAELGIKPLPKSFYDQWPATRDLVKAAEDLDIALVPQDKFIDPNRCDPACDKCMLGCRKGAKWTSREFVHQAQRRGARLLDRTSVDRLILENGTARGVSLKGPHGISEIRADKVVLSAGGMGTPVILQKSGLPGAGEGFFIDPMNVVWAFSRYPGSINEQTFSVASEEFMEPDGFMIGNLGAFALTPWALYGRLRGKKYTHVMGLFTKIGDSPGGRIDIRGNIVKPYSREDMARFKKGTETCRKILIRAGTEPDSMHIGHNVGGHPGGTAAIGRVVDRDLQAYKARNLFICDASVFPKSPGRPPTLTIIALAKHLAARMGS